MHGRVVGSSGRVMAVLLYEYQYGTVGQAERRGDLLVTYGSGDLPHPSTARTMPGPTVPRTIRCCECRVSTGCDVPVLAT